MTTPAIQSTNGETIAREQMILYLNTGTSGSPTWSPIGMRVSESSMGMDFSADTTTDILGVTRTRAKKPKVTQSFDSYPLDSGDAAVVKIWEDGIRDQNPQALCNKDILVVHFYYGASTSAPFAERHPSSAIFPTEIGGEGGGDLTMNLEVTYGGERTTGTASIDSSTGAISFTPAS